MWAKKEGHFCFGVKKILTIKIGEGIGAAKLALFSEQFFFPFFFFFNFCLLGYSGFFGGKKRVGFY